MEAEVLAGRDEPEKAGRPVPLSQAHVCHNVSSLQVLERACETSPADAELSAKDQYALSLFRRALQVALHHANASQVQPTTDGAGRGQREVEEGKEAMETRTMLH